MGKTPNAVIGFEVEDPHLPNVGRGDLARRRAGMDQIKAISAFEGLHPKPAFAALQEQYVSGEISIQQLRKAVDARWKRNA